MACKQAATSGRVNLSNLALENRLIGGKYRLLKSIGSGSFGEIYQGIDTQTGGDVAVKIEACEVKYPLLAYESKIYEAIGSHLGMPACYHYGSEKRFNVLVMELLGLSLEELFNLCKRKFSIKTVLMLGDQMLMRLECVHQHGFIHRDIKPDNFLMGLGRHCSKLYIIDFGLAKRYVHPKTHEHIPYRDDRNLTGTARYASVNAQRGVEQARRDDLESLSYCIMYFSLGKLPWQGLVAQNKQQKYEKIWEMKRSLCIDEAFKDKPMEFALFLKYARNLRFTDRPDYVYLRQLFRVLFRSLNHQYDHVFDWTPLQKEQRKKDRERERERVRQRESEMKINRRQRLEFGSRSAREPIGDGLKHKR
ncbi:CG7094 [Drosophila busckii]|uniref:non-specific serine/threonine protein kinase n=1 Tax=Drosophila busckii TaxID=30019 RepID=A0A0M3QTC5_DROBS|nr:casein kinase I [Drosophila busckii]ALC38673.1 CG7094 [Drosophila busckii]